MATLFADIFEHSWTSLLLFIVICLFTYVYVRWSQRIPGPTGLPYLGYYPFLKDETLHTQLAEMTEKYGEVFCFTITGQMYAHIGSFKMMKEALVTKGNCFTRKSPNFNLLLDSIGDGVFYTSGEAWKVLRRFFSQKLKDYGMGKNIQEAWMVDSLQRTIEALKNSEGKNFQVTDFFTENGTVAMHEFLFGLANVDEEDVRRVVEDFKIFVSTMTGRRLLLAGPLLKLMMPFMSAIASHKKAKAETDFILAKILKQHEKDFDKNNIRNLVDCYIDERRTLEEKGDPRSKIYTEKAFIDTVIQILGDGSLTIGTLAATVLKAISDKPEVQKRIQSEVDEVVGRECFPSWDLRNRMPYTVAVIYETIRTSNFFLFFPSLECTEETTVGGCPIPKGTILFLNLYSALRDQRIYENPEIFDPTRFLSDKDNKPKSELPNIFGMGKRSCIGEILVNMETFLFVTTVMQNFDLLPATTKEQQGFGTEWNIWIRAAPRKS